MRPSTPTVSRTVLGVLVTMTLLMYSGFLVSVGWYMQAATGEAGHHVSQTLVTLNMRGLREQLGRQQQLVADFTKRLETLTESQRLVHEAVAGQQRALQTTLESVSHEVAFATKQNDIDHEHLRSRVHDFSTAAQPMPWPATPQKPPAATPTTAPVQPRSQNSAPTAAPLSAHCATLMSRDTDPERPLVEVSMGVHGKPGAQPTTMDLKLGRVFVTVRLTKFLENCNRFNVSNEIHDPYVEAHILRQMHRMDPTILDAQGNPSYYVRACVACNRLLPAELNRAFGNASVPHADRLSITQVSDLVIDLRPRKNVETSTPVHVEVSIPKECFHYYSGSPEVGATQSLKRLHAETTQIPIRIAAPAEKMAQLSGDVLEQLHDGILLDGGRAGRLSLSHGLQWNWAVPTFVEDFRDLLKSVFGPADDGHPDAVVPGWDASTADFVLGPRHIARNHHGRTVKTFPDISNRMLLTKNGAPPAYGVPIPEPVAIEDVVTPYIELDITSAFTESRKGVNTVPKDVIIAGGLSFTLTLHAGVFFIKDRSAVVHHLKKTMAETFGPHSSSQGDVVTVESPTQATVVLGSRKKAPPPWLAQPSPFTDKSKAPPATHRVLRFTVPDEILVTPPLNAPSECLLPDVDYCAYAPYTGTPLAPIPAITAELQDRLVFKWAVVGAGPSGMNGLGRVMDLWAGREDQVLWIDERGFKVGRLEGYHDVQSMNPCADFVNYMKDYKVYTNPEIGSSQSPLLNFEGSARNCRLGYLSEPLLKATRQFRSKLVSYHGRVTDMHKVWFPNATKTNASTDFVWSMEVAGDGRPMIVTDGVLLAIGADHKSNTFPLSTGELPTEIPFTSSLNPGKLRTFITQDVTAKGLKESGKRVAVFGAGPSGVVALHNLALLPEVDSVVHFTHGPRGDFTNIRTAKHNGEYLNITRVKYDANADHLAADLKGTDYMIQCAGWVWPSFPYNGSIQIANKGATKKEGKRDDAFVSPKLFSVGVQGGDKPKAGRSHSQLFFMSSLLAVTKRSTQRCTAGTLHQGRPFCMEEEYPPIPYETLMDFAHKDTYVKPAEPWTAW